MKNAAELANGFTELRRRFRSTDRKVWFEARRVAIFKTLGASNRYHRTLTRVGRLLETAEEHPTDFPALIEFACYVVDLIPQWNVPDYYARAADYAYATAQSMRIKENHRKELRHMISELDYRHTPSSGLAKQFSDIYYYEWSLSEDRVLGMLRALRREISDIDDAEAKTILAIYIQTNLGRRSPFFHTPAYALYEPKVRDNLRFAYMNLTSIVAARPTDKAARF